MIRIGPKQRCATGKTAYSSHEACGQRIEAKVVCKEAINGLKQILEGWKEGRRTV